MASSRGNQSSSKGDKVPELQLVVRDHEGWRLYKQNLKTGKLQIQCPTKPCTDADIVFSPDGQFFAVLLEKGIEIYETHRGRKLLFLEHYRVRNVYFSPSNAFLVSYHHRRNQDKKGNCWVWKWSGTNEERKENADPSKKAKSSGNDTSADSGGGVIGGNSMKVIFQFFLPEFDKKRVPFQFSNDEQIAARISKNSVLVHDVQRLHFKSNNIIGKLDVAHAASVVVAPCRKPRKQQEHKHAAHEDPDVVAQKNKPQSSYLLAVFAMPKNNKAATVTIYEFQYSAAMKANKSGSQTFHKISQRAFMGVDTCELLWCPSKSYHHNLLAIASSDVDTSGKSYYGHQTLYLLSSRNSMTVRIPIAEKGKLQDVQWHPNGREFVMIDDHPQKISIFDNRGNSVADLGRYARNLIRFSPNGRFLWLGGFGNLTGEMTFYDYKMVKDSSQKGKCLGYNTDDACRYFEWSPDASSLVTARLYPYMTVDNGFRIYRYNGERIHEQTFDRLYQVTYRPSAPFTYPNRSPSPKSKNAIRSLPKPQEKKKWIPPHKRGAAAKSAMGKSAATGQTAARSHAQRPGQSAQQSVSQQSRQSAMQPQAHQQAALGQYHQNAYHRQNAYPQGYQQQQALPMQHHRAQEYGAQHGHYGAHPPPPQQPQQQAPRHQGQHQGQYAPHYQQHHGPPAVVPPTGMPAAIQQGTPSHGQFGHNVQGHYAQQQPAMQQQPGPAQAPLHQHGQPQQGMGGNGNKMVNGQQNEMNGQKKRRRRRNKKKNSPNNGDNAEVGSNGNANRSNSFKPGLHDNKRWARGSKYEG